MRKRVLIEKIIGAVLFCAIGLGLPLLAILPEGYPLHFFKTTNKNISASWVVFFCIFSFCYITFCGWGFLFIDSFRSILQSVFGKKKRTFVSIIGFLFFVLLIMGIMLGICGMGLSR